MDANYAGYLLTWNPAKWDDGDWISAAAQTARAGQRPGTETWSTAGRRHGYRKGDRIFLLKQGKEPRGIVGSGWVDHDEGSYMAEHWDGSGRLTPYIDVDWEHFVDPGSPLPTEQLSHAAKKTNWRPQGSGASINEADLPIVERMWADHTGLSMPQLGSIAALADPLAGRRRQHPASAGWQKDPELRRKAEDYAQRMLEDSFRDEGWTVEDRRAGNPFDAVASRSGQTKYLEAKGTSSDGAAVQVTAGEVRFATDHRGACVIGIVSGLQFGADGDLLTGTGTLRRYDWEPHNDDLHPIAYGWSPRNATNYEPTRLEPRIREDP